MFFLPFFMQGSWKQDLLYRIEGGANDGTAEEESPDGALRSYDKVVNNRLQTNADDSIIVATEAAINALRQPENQSLLEFKNVIFAGAWRWRRVYG